MGTELDTPKSFDQVVKDRVRTILLDTVQDEQIEELLKKAYEDFFVAPKKNNYYDQAESPFYVLVKGEIESHIKAKIGAEIKRQTETQWNPETNTQEHLETLVKSLVPIALQSAGKVLVSEVLMQIQNNSSRY